MWPYIKQLGCTLDTSPLHRGRSKPGEADSPEDTASRHSREPGRGSAAEYDHAVIFILDFSAQEP